MDNLLEKWLLQVEKINTKITEDTKIFIVINCFYF